MRLPQSYLARFGWFRQVPAQLGGPLAAQGRLVVQERVVPPEVQPAEPDPLAPPGVRQAGKGRPAGVPDPVAQPAKVEHKARQARRDPASVVRSDCGPKPPTSPGGGWVNSRGRRSIGLGE